MVYALEGGRPSRHYPRTRRRLTQYAFPLSETANRAAGSQQTVWNSLEVWRWAADMFSSAEWAASSRLAGGRRVTHGRAGHDGYPTLPVAKPKLWRRTARSGRSLAAVASASVEDGNGDVTACPRVCVCAGRSCLLNDCWLITTDKSRRWRVRTPIKPTSTCRMPFILRSSLVEGALRIVVRFSRSSVYRWFRLQHKGAMSTFSRNRDFDTRWWPAHFRTSGRNVKL